MMTSDYPGAIILNMTSTKTIAPLIRSNLVPPVLSVPNVRLVPDTGLILVYLLIFSPAVHVPARLLLL